MFDFFVSYPVESIFSLAFLSFVINAFFARDSDDPIFNSFFIGVVEWAVLGLIAGAVCMAMSDVVNGEVVRRVSFVGVSCSMVFYFLVLNILGIVVAYLWKKIDVTKRYKKYRYQSKEKKERNEVVETAENICGKMQLPTTAKTELGKALKEWKIVNKEIVPVKKLLEQHRDALSKVKKLEDEAWIHQSNVNDKDLKESYANTARELSSQCDELQKLVGEYQQQVDEKNARIGELLKLFKKAEKDAKSYKEYDKFTAEALEVQKELRATLLKVKKHEVKNQ